jgi:hypothetical protein
MFSSNEPFNQIDICDYDSPDPSQFCKSIKKGCNDLIDENKKIEKNINDNCTTLPTNVKDLIDVAINCSDATDKQIMNNYVKKEVCSQIKNFPKNSPSTDVNLQSPEISTSSSQNDNIVDESSNELDNSINSSGIIDNTVNQVNTTNKLNINNPSTSDINTDENDNVFTAYSISGTSNPSSSNMIMPFDYKETRYAML